MDDNKITAGADVCLGFALSGRFPFSRVAAYIEELKHDPNWTLNEVIAVQTRVIRVLMGYERYIPRKVTRPEKEAYRPFRAGSL